MLPQIEFNQCNEDHEDDFPKNLTTFTFTGPIFLLDYIRVISVQLKQASWYVTDFVTTSDLTSKEENDYSYDNSEEFIICDYLATYLLMFKKQVKVEMGQGNLKKQKMEIVSNKLYLKERLSTRKKIFTKCEEKNLRMPRRL